MLPKPICSACKTLTTMLFLKSNDKQTLGGKQVLTAPRVQNCSKLVACTFETRELNCKSLQAATSDPTSDPTQQSEIRPAISNWPALVWCKQHLFLLSHLWCSFPFWCPIVSPVVQLLSFLPLQRFLSSVNIHVWPLIEHWPINIYWTIWGQNSWTNKECALNLKCSIIINDNANNKTVS